MLTSQLILEAEGSNVTSKRESDCPQMEEFGFGLFDDLLEDEPHPLQIDDFEDEQDYKRRLQEKELNVYAPVNGDTRLHRAIRSGKQIEINALLEVYREDFDKVRDHLVVKYGWNGEDKIWFEKRILVANTEEQCQSAKNLENHQIDAEDLRRAVLVLLKYPVKSEEVAVLHPNKTNRSAAVKLIKTLIPNGFLSWNYFSAEGYTATFMEAAATKGMHNVIDRLYELGAPIAIPDHNPLLPAIRSNRKETAKWLLTKHFDHFDCTLRDSGANNALVAAMQRNDGDLFDFLLEKMIAYRQKYFNDTEEEAFHDIFRVEHEEYYYSSIFTYVKKAGPIFDRVERAVQKYKLKLSHQYKYYVVLGRLIEGKIALNYCFESIRNDPQLLNLKEHESTTILQQLIRWQHFDFVREMYTKHPEVKSFFNTDHAFEMLRQAIYDQNRETVQFILEHHVDYVKGDMEKLKEHVVCCKHYTKEFYEPRRKLLVESFPELRENIEEEMAKAQTEKYYYSIEGSFSKMNIDVSRLDKLPEPYSIARGSNGETLLHLAAEKDNKELFIRMLEAGCELDALDNDGNQPVHLVKSEEMLELIIDRHPEGRNIIQRTNNDGCTVLHKVCQQRMDHKPLMNLLEKVIEYGANVHQLTKSGESAVFFVGSCRILDVLQKHGIQLDITNDAGETALQRHLYNGNYCMSIPLFSYLHELPSFKEHAHKYLAPMLNQYGHVYTYDYKVIFEKYPEAARIMLDSVYEHSREEATRLFSKACGTGFTIVVEMFLDGDYDLDFNYRDRYEDTPLLGMINFIEQANPHVIKRIVEKGVDMLARDQWGKDALISLVWRYRSGRWNKIGLETVQLLLDHGASIGTTDQDGNTPLHYAFQANEMELVEFLIENGADLSAVNSAGKRPYEVAPKLYQELFFFYCDK